MKIEHISRYGLALIGGIIFTSGITVGLSAALPRGAFAAVINAVKPATTAVKPATSTAKPAAAAPACTCKIVDQEAQVMGVVDRVSPAVVSIVVKQSDGHGSLKTIRQGTGFIVSADGTIVTNHHVADSRDNEYVIFLPDDSKYIATLVDIDPIYDLAVLKIPGSNLPTVSLAALNNIKLGQTVLAIGNSFGLENSITKGIVSGLGRSVEANIGIGSDAVFEGIIQTDAAINPGNSGGPLLNLAGEVVGVNTLKIFSDGNQSADNTGFAIPVAQVHYALDSLKMNQRIVRPRIGLRYLTITPAVSEELGLPTERGAIVRKGPNNEPAVVAGGPADVAGFHENDIIVKVGGRDLTKSYTLLAAIQDQKIGQTVSFLVLRDSKPITIFASLDRMVTDFTKVVQ